MNKILADYLTPFERLTLTTIVPNLADHIWMTGFRMPEIIEKNLDYGAWCFISPRANTHDIDIIQDVPGNHQMLFSHGEDNKQFHQTPIQETLSCQAMLSRRLANFRAHIQGIAQWALQQGSLGGENVLSLQFSPSEPFGIKGVIAKKSEINREEHGIMRVNQNPDGSISYGIDLCPATPLLSMSGDMFAMNERIDFWEIYLKWPLPNHVEWQMGPFYIKKVRSDKDKRRYAGFEKIFRNSPFMMARLRQTCLEQLMEIADGHRRRLEREARGEIA